MFSRRELLGSMFTLVVQIRKPRDSAIFEDHFWRVHLPLVKSIPELRKVIVHRIIEARGGDADLYGLTELHFNDQAAFERAMASQEAKDGIRDGQRLERRAGTVMSFDYFCETTEA